MYLNGAFYTQWKHQPYEPYHVLFISEPDTVCWPYPYSGQYPPFTHCSSVGDAYQRAGLWEEKGYQFFVYKTFATSSTELNWGFLAYSNEAKSFIIAHELLHNYVHQTKMKIPYEFHEALADVVGNTCSYKMAATFLNLNLTEVEKEIGLTEKIYTCLNGFVARINKSEKRIDSLQTNCHAEIEELLKGADSFQRDRFANSGNNAFLLKNTNYSKNYFLIKRVLLRQGSVMKLLEIMKGLPADPEACALYLETFAAEK